MCRNDTALQISAATLCGVPPYFQKGAFLMEHRRLRVPRSLLRKPITLFHPSNATNTVNGNTEALSDTSKPIYSQPLPDTSAIDISCFTVPSDPLCLLHSIVQRSQLTFQNVLPFRGILTLEGLTEFSKGKCSSDIYEMGVELSSLLQRCSDTLQFLQSQKEAYNLQTRNALLLYEQASMTHEDNMERLFRDIKYLWDQNTTASQTMVDLGGTMEQLKAALGTSQDALKVANQELEALDRKRTISTWKSTAALQLISQINEALREFALYRDRVIVFRSSVEVKRRVLHNRLQELKGNLRVFCRIRPPLSDELTQDTVSFSVSQDETQLSIVQPEPKCSTQKSGILSHGKEMFRFRFDHVFSPSSTQEDVFQEVSNLIQSALDGFNVALFAYGQTGGGKTFTMEGKGGLDKLSSFSKSASPSTDAMSCHAGIVPRAVDLIFHEIRESVLKGWQYTTELSILEIYNETVKDLLGSETQHIDGIPARRHGISCTAIKPQKSDASSGNTTSRYPSHNATSPGSNCEIKLDSRGNIMLTNVVSIPIQNAHDVYRYLTLSQKQRSVASTACNQHSSRSHSIVQLKFKGRCLKDHRTIQSTLSMIDLAGSERIEKSLVMGDRLREAQYINKSLSSLGDVIYAIANRKSHVPFRNSKLTMLLKDSLGGQAKTLMFVNICPLVTHFKETLTSLRFAVKANSCSLH